jgi:hypothetical protein
MNLRTFAVALGKLLGDSHRSVAERLERALWDFTPTEEASAVILLNWFDWLRESGPLDRQHEEPPDGWCLPPDCLDKDYRPALDRAQGRARVRRAQRNQGPPVTPEQLLGRSRLLVLTEDGDAGACVWLTVTAVRPVEGRTAAITLAEGSFFAVAEDEDFRQVQASLWPALTTVFADTAAGQAAVEGASFLLELSPLRPSDLDPDWGSASPVEQLDLRLEALGLTPGLLEPLGAAERAAVVQVLEALALAPSLLDLHGPLLGLPLGLAAAAALRGKSSCSVLATGALDPDRIGQVSGVGGLRGKAWAMRQLRRRPAAVRRYSDECDEVHLGNALTTDGKIVFLLHEEGSRALWDPALNQEEWVLVRTAPRFRVAKILHDLAFGRLPGWKRQFVVLVCSDLHHQAVLRDALPSQRSV